MKNDDLNAIRGIVNAVIASLVIWTFVVLVVALR